MNRPIVRCRLLIALAPMVVAGLLVSSCGGTREGESTTADAMAAADTAQVQEEAPSRTESFFSSLPSPVHLARMFKRSGLKYNATLGHDPAKASQYQSNTARALNLGAYTTNLGYATFNNQSQRALDYFKAVRTLGDGLSMSSMFEQTNLLPRFERNLGNQDSLVYLMSQLSLESDMLLRGANRLDVVYLTFAGAWVETMYLATSLAPQNNNQEVYDRIVDQRNSLRSLLSLLEEANEGGSLDQTIGNLRQIGGQLDTVAAQSQGSATSAEFSALAQQVAKVRQQMITST